MNDVETVLNTENRANYVYSEFKFFKFQILNYFYKFIKDKYINTDFVAVD